MSDKLTRAVEQWIRAEWCFRLGPYPYTREAEGWLLQAERKLRRALTGKGKLGDAHKVLKEKQDE